MRLRTTDNFDQRLKNILRKNKSLGIEIQDVVQQLLNGESNDGLRLHQLEGDLSLFWSISINDDLRILFYSQNDTIVLSDIGTHKEVYGEH
ncbi:type II toxin-antitoxin system mRNA interferase toxin, RelE/StbE family [Candidatus Shapirobacteria bacterium]|nr:type II toxin-antitoxin system mRNA interferase toxin, RelE/StbE family [Candidatus Shapirobacteria bacterium]